ncbi:MAG: von Willebrand factor type A domain-containing protein [Akkermansiaceae bacterium]|nr:von Willebrand factor type A domain-containing protein [Akkermansiaceae bacterium]
MNENEFIDNALKEHARLEGQNDQGFLDQLESQLDMQNVTELKNEEKDSGAKKFFWPAIAATVAVSAVAISPMFKHEPQDQILASTANESESRESSDSTEPKRDRRMASLDVRKSGVDPQGSPLAAPGVSHPIAEVQVESSLVEDGGRLEEGKDFLMAKGGKGFLGETSAARLPSPEMAKVIPAATSMPVSDLALGTERGVSQRGSMRTRYTGGIVDFDEPRKGHSSGFDPVQPGNKYGALIDGGFLSPLSSALSTFSIDVDTASYTNIRRHIMNGQPLHPDAVRIEEMINYFDYRYAQPEGDHPFAVHTEVASCPWNPKHRLVRIGLQGEKIDKGERKAANLVFLLDVSGSMKSPDKLPLLVQSFQILLKQLNEEDRVSLVVYAGRQAVLLNPTAIDEDGRTEVSEALKKLSAGGSTAGAAGIKTAYELARKGFVEGGVNRVILATDGDFNVGTTNSTELEKLVKNQAEGNISLTILGFGQGNLNDAMMEKLTNSGDGNYFYLDSLREGQKVFQEGLTGTIQTIAKDVKIQVEFNPGKVGRYRLIGYANRRLKDEDFKNDKVDAGDIGAGHRVTALYEIVPAGVMVANDLKYQKVKEELKLDVVDSPEMLTVKLRYKQPDGDVSTELARPLTDTGNPWEKSSEDFKFSSGVALWGMLLRNSPYAGSGTPELVSELSSSGQGDDVNGDRVELMDLVRRWSSRR